MTSPARSTSPGGSNAQPSLTGRLALLKLFDGVRLISRLLRLGLIVIAMACQALRSRSARLKMTIPTGRDAGQQNVRGACATGGRVVAGDTLEYAVGLVIEVAVR